MGQVEAFRQQGGFSVLLDHCGFECEEIGFLTFDGRLDDEILLLGLKVDGNLHFLCLGRNDHGGEFAV